MAEVPQCPGCNGEHQANSCECPLVQHAHDIEQLRSEGLSYLDALTKLKEPGMAGNLRKLNYSTHPQSKRNFSTNSQSPRNSNNEASSSLTLSYRDAWEKKTVHQKVQL